MVKISRNSPTKSPETHTDKGGGQEVISGAINLVGS